LDKIVYLLETLSVLFVVILIHESGHYLVARVLRCRVLEFSIGFGPEAKYLGTYKGTDFVVRWIPVGGYVYIDDLEANLEHTKWFRLTLLRNIIVYAAGPLANIVGAVVVLAVYGIVGQDYVQGTPWFSMVDSWMTSFTFMSIVIVFFNLLPIPPLDGGRIMLAFIEMVRRRTINAGCKGRVLKWGVIVVAGYVIVDWLVFFYSLFVG
jgi:membrane-associated protease RseP (regulator of RpoE activity)